MVAIRLPVAIAVARAAHNRRVTGALSTVPFFTTKAGKSQNKQAEGIRTATVRIGLLVTTKLRDVPVLFLYR